MCEQKIKQIFARSLRYAAHLTSICHILYFHNIHSSLLGTELITQGMKDFMQALWASITNGLRGGPKICHFL